MLPPNFQTKAFVKELFSTYFVVSILLGVVIGVVTSLIVNATLVEISINAFFSLYYGLIFIGIGVFILSRLRNEKYQTDPSYIERKPYIGTISLHIIISGFICFLLEKDWFVGLSPLKKIPLYSILGSAITLAFVFSFVDFVNYFFGLCQRATERSVLETPKQIFSVSAISLFMGFTYGLIFGWMDIEDADQYALELKLMKDENYCMHIGIVLGGIGGFVNEFLRRDLTRFVFHKLEADPFSEEI